MNTAREVLTAVIEKIAECVPEAECYKGRLEEGFSVPAFLLNLTFVGGAKANYFTERKNIEIQIIYFGTEDGYGREDFEERLDVESRLMPFLNQHSISIGERVLSFNYEMKETDSRLAIYLTFHYLDESIDQRYVDAENMEAAKDVSVRMKAMADE